MTISWQGQQLLSSEVFKRVLVNQIKKAENKSIAQCQTEELLYLSFPSISVVTLRTFVHRRPYIR